jgi:hypothetical protein
MNEQNVTTEATKKTTATANWNAWASMGLKAKRKVAAIMNFDAVIGERDPKNPTLNADAIAKTLTRPADPKFGRKAVTVHPNFARDVLARYSALYYSNPVKFAASAW